MKTVTRESPVPEQRFKEMTEGETPHSVELSLNAKGAAQFSIKLHYETPAEIHANVRNDLRSVIAEIKSALDEWNIPLAGGYSIGKEG